ncbi:MAG: DUF3703 domain-containing protein [Pseudomonadota bacterium]
MKPELRSAYRQSLSSAKSKYRAGNHDAAFSDLETAHVLGQQFLLPHITVHVWMLRVSAARQDNREIRGQIVRLAATVPGFLVGWVPLGNTGGANVSALKPMPVPGSLAGLVPKPDMVRQLSIRLISLIGILLILQAF